MTTSKSLMVGSSSLKEGTLVLRDNSSEGSNNSDEEAGAIVIVHEKTDSGHHDDFEKEQPVAVTQDPANPPHSKWIWLHAAYHSLVTIVGTGILGYPYATAYLGEC